MSLFYQPHQIEKQRKQYVCIVCKRTWSRKSEISQDCPRPERPIYSKWQLYDVNDASCRSSSSSVSTIPLSASTGCAMTVALSSKMPMSSP